MYYNINKMYKAVRSFEAFMLKMSHGKRSKH